MNFEVLILIEKSEGTSETVRQTFCETNFADLLVKVENYRMHHLTIWLKTSFLNILTIAVDNVTPQTAYHSLKQRRKLLCDLK